MPFVRIWVHLVWTTKNRDALLVGELTGNICKHIAENAQKKEIYLDTINGDLNHIHALISLGSEQTIAKIAQLLKGESSFWINKNKISKLKFEWQDEYFAISVSESLLSKVREYIKNQEEHHRKKTWDEEYSEFLTKYGF